VTDELRVEAEGETVGDAKWAALREIERRVPGIDRTAVQLQVVSEGQRGLLGVGAQPAKVVVVAPAAAIVAARGGDDPAAAAAAVPTLRRVEGESDAAAQLRQLLELAGAALGVGTEVAIAEGAETITATCSGADLGVLIGKHGQTIDALQYLANAILHRQGVPQEAILDAAGYRDRRQEALAGIASRAVDEALVRGVAVSLDPMTSVERKHVHLLLKDDPRVETGSDGAEPNRFVVVRPAAGA
jgi:spoIIIJ-associated protein